MYCVNVSSIHEFTQCNIVCVCVHCIVVTLLYLHLFTPVLLYWCMIASSVFCMAICAFVPLFFVLRGLLPIRPLFTLCSWLLIY